MEVEFPWVKGKKSFIRFKIYCSFQPERISRIVAKIYEKAEIYLNEEVMAITSIICYREKFRLPKGIFVEN